MESYLELCRICLSNKGQISVYENGLETSFMNMVVELTDTEIQLENLPSHLCKNCIPELEIAYRTKKIIQNSYAKFIEILHDLKNTASPACYVQQTSIKEELHENLENFPQECEIKSVDYLPEDTLTNININYADQESYEEKMQLIEHLENEKKICEKCDTDFSTYENLLSHSLLHKDEHLEQAYFRGFSSDIEYGDINLSDVDIKKESEEDLLLSTVKLKRKPERIDKCWNLEKVFFDAKMAETFVKKEKCWSFSHANKVKEGKKNYYRCNNVKLREDKCQASVYLFYAQASRSVKLYRSGLRHTCPTNNMVISFIPDEVKGQINSMIASNVEPKKILKTIENSKISSSTKNHIISYLNELENTRLARPNSNRQRFRRTCNEENIEKHSSIIESFILAENLKMKKLKQRKQKINKRWKMEMVFETANKAEEFIKNQKIWSFASLNKIKDGKKFFYRCNRVKFHGKQCDAAVYLFYTKDKVIFFKSQFDHTCDIINNKHT